MPYKPFKQVCSEEITLQSKNKSILKTSNKWINQAQALNYSYHFEWLGRPIIQYPQDIVSMQELIWEVKPDLIIETGIAHGGSLIFSASMLALLEYCDATEKDKNVVSVKNKRRVLGLDVDIRTHNRIAMENHPMFHKIEMIEGSSIDEAVIARVHQVAKEYKKVLVCLDSKHTHDHVIAELEAYAPLVSVGSYCVVFDTVIEDMPNETFSDRPWEHGNNPKTAVREYLKLHPEFEIDKAIQNKLLITVAPDGYLKRLR